MIRGSIEYLRLRTTLQIESFIELTMIFGDQHCTDTYIDQGEDLEVYNRRGSIDIELHCESEHSQGSTEYITEEDLISDWNEWIKDREEAFFELINSEEFNEFPHEEYEALQVRCYEWTLPKGETILSTGERIHYDALNERRYRAKIEDPLYHCDIYLREFFEDTYSFEALADDY